MYNRKNQLAIEESDQEKIRFTYNQQGSMISREGRLESEGFSITAKTNRYEQRRKMARYKKTDTMQKDCVMKSEKTKTVSGLCIIRESCCMRKGEIQNHYQYDAFGNGICKEEGIFNRIRYTGQQYDGITGQYYLRARFYNPIVGRFLQEDVYQGDGVEPVCLLWE